MGGGGVEKVDVCFDWCSDWRCNCRNKKTVFAKNLVRLNDSISNIIKSNKHSLYFFFGKLWSSWIFQLQERERERERIAAEKRREWLEKKFASLNVKECENTDNVFMAMCSFKRYTLLLMFFNKSAVNMAFPFTQCTYTAKTIS